MGSVQHTPSFRGSGAFDSQMDSQTSARRFPPSFWLMTNLERTLKGLPLWTRPDRVENAFRFADLAQLLHDPLRVAHKEYPIALRWLTRVNHRDLIPPDFIVALSMNVLCSMSER
jgi:hypothetical protein